MAKLFNRAKMTTTTTGTGTITLGSASNGFQSFADAGVANGDVVQYVIEEGANFEIGTGTYTSSGTTLTRSPSESSSSDAAITLAGQATVSITAVAADMNRLQHNGSDKVTVSATGASVTGNISVTGTVDGRDIATDGSKLDGIAASANNYSLPLSSSSTRGGVKIGYAENGKNYPVELSSEKMFVNVPWTDTNTTYSQATSGTLGLVKIGYTENGKNYPVELSSGQMYVNVPWTDTDTNTTYTAGSGLSLSGTTFSHSDTSTQASVNNSGRTYIQDITLDTYGHITGITSATETVVNTDTTYSAGSGLSLSGTTFSHTDTSSQSSVNNSGNTVIQDVTLDTYGHVTGLTSKALSIPAAANNATITLSAGTGLSGGGNFTTNQSSNETITFNLEAPYTYIDTATGNYGTVKVDDDRSVTWAGYAIRNDWVFMSNGATTAGLYNDTDNEWHLYMTRNGATDIRYNGSTKLATTNTGIDVSGDIIINNTTTKISEGSADAVRITTDDGYVDIGPMNTTWCHFQTDRGKFYMNKALHAETELRVYNTSHGINSSGHFGDGSALTGIVASARNGYFWENNQTITSNQTITNNKNAMSAGPITVNTGVTVTVGDGEAWTIV